MLISSLLVDCDTCRKVYKIKGKEPPCDTCVVNKSKPDILPANYMVLEVLNKFGGMIYNGESIDSNGIRLAMELEYIPESKKGLFTRKLIAYFSKIRELQSEELKKGLK